MKKYLNIAISVITANVLFANWEQWDYENLDNRDFVEVEMDIHIHRFDGLLQKIQIGTESDYNMPN